MDLSVVWKYLTVFAVGGALCVPAQLLIDKTKLTPARILVGYVVTGVILGAGVVSAIGGFCGSGRQHAVDGLRKRNRQGCPPCRGREGVTRCSTGGLSAAAGGTAAALIFGYLAALFCRGKPKD